MNNLLTLQEVLATSLNIIFVLLTIFIIFTTGIKIATLCAKHIVELASDLYCCVKMATDRMMNFEEGEEIPEVVSEKKLIAKKKGRGKGRTKCLENK